MFSSYFKQTEEFTYNIFTETRSPKLRLECGCLRLSCESKSSWIHSTISFHGYLHILGV